MANRVFKVVPIGVVESAGEVSKIRVFAEFCDGLYRLSEFSHLIVLYWFHERDTENERRVLRVVPKRHQAREEVGVFASRSPSRPNPIGLCIVKLVKIEGYSLTVEGLDAFKDSPIIDIILPCVSALCSSRPGSIYDTTRIQIGSVTSPSVSSPCYFSSAGLGSE